MPEVQLEVATTQSVGDCATTFSEAIKSSYGAGRILARGASMLRGSDTGGVEFFKPTGAPAGCTYSAGAMLAGHNLMTGATKMALHMYVIDRGNDRLVKFVGPYGFGDKGSTDRLMRKVAAQF